MVGRRGFKGIVYPKIIYSHSCHSKPVCLFFSFWKKYFLSIK